MRYALTVIAFLVALGMSLAMCERVQEDLATPGGKIETAASEGAKRFVEAPGPGTAASWGMEVLIAVLSVATGGLGLTQIRDRNARRRVEVKEEELRAAITSIAAALRDSAPPAVTDWLRGLGFAEPSEAEKAANLRDAELAEVSGQVGTATAAAGATSHD